MVVTRNFVTAYSIKHLCESISQGCSGPGKQYRVSFQRLVDKVGIFVRHIIAVGEMVRHGIDILLEQNDDTRPIYKLTQYDIWRRHEIR